RRPPALFGPPPGRGALVRPPAPRDGRDLGYPHGGWAGQRNGNSRSRLRSRGDLWSFRRGRPRGCVHPPAVFRYVGAVARDPRDRLANAARIPPPRTASAGRPAHLPPASVSARHHLALRRRLLGDLLAGGAGDGVPVPCL